MTLSSAFDDPSAPRQIVMVGFDNHQILDIVGPMEMFSGASQTGDGVARYATTLAASKTGPLTSTGQMRLMADRTFDSFTEADLRKIDTLLIAGGVGISNAMREGDVMAFIKRAAPHARRIGSICTGAFALARLGMLDGRRATTHWEEVGRMKDRYPEIDVEEDALYVRDEHIWTSAGVTAGIDMALAMIEDDYGHDVTLAVARRHVVYMIRPGGQSQFSARLIGQSKPPGRLGTLVEWLGENPSADLSVPALAERAAMSERSFARHFSAEVGMTPARFVERTRLDYARQYLEQESKSLDEVFVAAGFASAEQMRRSFQRCLNITPQAYRSRFRTLKGASA
ncbi:MAG: GlxA family transcriptional regulator [Parvibaculaceae bacterium]|nr:GlxA family transcriptional regulator [Parvibaculaceae bacterium]